MKTKSCCFFLVVLLFMTQWVQGQYYSTGQNPASVRWKQIHTDNFRVIYPEDYSSTAQYIANLLEYAASLDTTSLSAQPKKTPVIIHNFTAISNGMVVWAPRRMEFYSIPPQDGDGQEWFQQLAIHEYRHIIQISKLNQGLTNVLTYLFGEQITGAVLGLYLPFWFLEGDAVATETALSNTGRGRSPDFAMPLKTQLLQSRPYSYDKAVMGSFKDFVPDHYVLGYHLVAKGRQLYGTKIWNHTLDKIGRKPYMVVPFSEGIRDITGRNKTGFYEDMISRLTADWQRQNSVIDQWPDGSTLNGTKKIFTQYHRPHFSGNGSIIAEKYALNDIPRFVEILDDGSEQVLFTPGFFRHGSLTYAQNTLAWTEYAYDPRWQNRNYSVIRLWDMQSKKMKTLGQKQRYFAPSLSADGRKIVAVEVTENQMYKIVVLDVASGERMFELASESNDFFSRPAFSPDGNRIAVRAVNNFGNRLALINTLDSSYVYVSDPTFTDLGKPVFSGDSIIFTAAFNGISNLYSLHPESGLVLGLTSVPFGVDDPFVTPEGKIIFANYTADGYEITQADLAQLSPTPLARIENTDIKLYEDLVKQEGKIMEPELIPDFQFRESNYSKLANIFHFHSWAPVSIDVDNYGIKPGVSLLSQNLLSSAFTSLGWEYDLNEETGRYFINFSYEGLYPAFDLKADYGRRESFVVDEATEERIDFAWMETNFSVNVRVPLNVTKNKYARFIQPAVKFDYVQLDMDKDSPLEFRRSNYKALSYRLYAYNLLKQNFRDMHPRWGQIVDLTLRTAPFANDTLGSMFAGAARLFFPGLALHHSFNIYTGYQYRFDYNPLFANIIRFPRGFTGLRTDEVISVAANYKLPLLYPDLSLSSLAYIKRIKANVFYDYARGYLNGQSYSWQSAGVELFADLHLLRLPAPFEVGYRISFLPDQGEFRNEFLFSVNFGVF